jgi:hypothetical protein
VGFRVGKTSFASAAQSDVTVYFEFLEDDHGASAAVEIVESYREVLSFVGNAEWAGKAVVFQALVTFRATVLAALEVALEEVLVPNVEALGQVKAEQLHA